MSWSKDDIEMNVPTLEVPMLPGAAVVCVDVRGVKLSEQTKT